VRRIWIVRDALRQRPLVSFGKAVAEATEAELETTIFECQHFVLLFSPQFKAWNLKSWQQKVSKTLKRGRKPRVSPVQPTLSFKSTFPDAMHWSSKRRNSEVVGRIPEKSQVPRTQV
jgi:hypothetical protein